mmetsp:Transcript_27477/g.81452  ORF Transcript_27477/g.81452 Transcript_27477/m.81452 type:complete len:223 (-) Transcript_27477:114-782(-)
MAPKRKAVKATAAAAAKARKLGLSVGDDFPDLGPIETEQSTEENQKTVDLKDILKESGIMLFFYPRANTPGCTTQACGFRDQHHSLAGAGYQVFGMSADKPKAQLNWKTKNQFPYTLLCDPSLEALKALGVLQGKSVMRSHIFVEKGGKVAVVEYGITPKNSIAGAADFVEGKSGGAPKSMEEDIKAPLPEEQTTETENTCGENALKVKFTVNDGRVQVTID